MLAAKKAMDHRDDVMKYERDLARQKAFARKSDREKAEIIKKRDEMALKYLKEDPSITGDPVMRSFIEAQDEYMRKRQREKDAAEMKKYEEDAKAYEERKRLKYIQQQSKMQQRSRSKKRLRRSRPRRFK